MAENCMLCSRDGPYRVRITELSEIGELFRLCRIHYDQLISEKSVELVTN